VNLTQSFRKLTSSYYRRVSRSFRDLPRIPYRTVVDAGAHKGAFADAFLAVHKPEKLVLVEPNPHLVEQLRTKYASRAAIEIAPVALSASSGTVDFYLNRQSAASSLLPINPENDRWFGRKLDVIGKVTVPALTLRDLFEQYRLASVDLLKLDLQGMEGAVLDAGESILPRVNAIYTEVLFESLYKDAWLFFQLWPYLRQRGFTLCGITNVAHGHNGDLLQANAIFRRDK
jgi:FkbM family methyltransferase